MRGFNIASTATATSLVLLFATHSIAQDSRHITAVVSDHFTDNHRREVILDCETLLPVKLNTGETKLAPRVAFAAQFDLAPARVLLDQFNKMSPAQKQLQLASMPPYEAAILKAVAELPPETQERFYIARNDQRLLTTKDAMNLYEFLVTHAMAAHGVDKGDFKRAADLCHPYHGIK